MPALPPTSVAREPSLAQSHASSPAPRNRLLAALPAESLARLWPQLEPVEMPVRHELMVSGEPIPAVYFPETGYASMLARLADGAAAEVGMIGPEGMIGLPLLLGAPTALVDAIVQGPGTMLRLGANSFQRAVDEVPGLARLLIRYSLAFQEQVAQTAACNGHHAIDQRLARWLLMAHDRSEGDEFPMTQEFLALMLGVSRPGVTIAARMFQQAGLIHYRQGRLQVTDRDGLEATACECYGVVHRRFAELFGPAGT